MGLFQSEVSRAGAGYIVRGNVRMAVEAGSAGVVDSLHQVLRQAPLRIRLLLALDVPVVVPCNPPALALSPWEVGVPELGSEGGRSWA